MIDIIKYRKMHQQKQRLHWWMNNYTCEDLSEDEDEDDHLFSSDPYSEQGKIDNDLDFRRPQSCMSFPPSVGADQDAFVQTPQNMYAPYTPICKTPPNTPDTEVKDILKNRNVSISDDNVEAESELTTEPSQDDMEIEDTFSGKDRSFSQLDRSESDPRSNFSEMEDRNDTFLEYESELVESSGIFSSEYCSSVPVYNSNLQDLMCTDRRRFCNDSTSVEVETSLLSQASPERRMSLEEFVEFVQSNPTLLNQLQNVIRKSDNEGIGVPETSSGMSKNEETEDSMVNGNRKRKADERGFPDPDVCSKNGELSVKRRFHKSGQSGVTCKGNELNITLPSCVYQKSSITDEVSRVPHVDNINLAGTISEYDETRVLYGSATNDVSVRHRRLPEAVGFGQIDSIQLSGTSSSTSFIDAVLNQNANIVPTNSRGTDNHISPWFVEGNSHDVQNQTSIIWRDDNRPLTGDKLTQPSSAEFDSTTTLASNLKDVSSVTTTTSTSHKSASVDYICKEGELDSHSLLISVASSAEPFPQTVHQPDVSFSCLPPGGSTTMRTVVQNDNDNTSLHELNGPGNNTSTAGLDTALTLVHNNGTSRGQSSPGASLYSTNRLCGLSYSDKNLFADLHGNNDIKSGFSVPESSSSHDLSQEAYLECSKNSNAMIFRQNGSFGGNCDITTTSGFVTAPGNTSTNFTKVSVSTANEGGFNLSHNSDGAYANERFYTVCVAALENSADTTSTFVYVPVTSATDKDYITVPSFVHTKSDITLTETETGNEVEGSSYSGQEENVTQNFGCVTEAAGKMAIAELPRDANPELIEAYRKFVETGDKSAIVKLELKCAIRSKRHKEGKEDINVKFESAPHHELTEEEQQKIRRRKELNRQAAATHRERKKTKQQLHEQECQDLTKRNSELKKKVADLESKKQIFVNYFNSQGIVLPVDLTSLAVASSGGVHEHARTPGTSGSSRQSRWRVK